MDPVYLDYNATTPVDSRVLEAMLPCLRENFGNPSSAHAQGRAARVLVDEAREKVARLIGGHPAELVFTSGGTEADNLAILGVARGLRSRGKHIITCRVEHPAVLNACRQLEAEGFQVEVLPVDKEGRVQPQDIAGAISGETTLISIQHANSEIGTLQDIEAIGQLAREKGVLFHVDAVQSAGKMLLDVGQIPVDLLSLSAHKMYGPKGVGALYLKRGTSAVEALLFGGGQEKKRRGGTENVPGIVGFGMAAELAATRVQEDSRRMENLRDMLREGLTQRISGVRVHTPTSRVLPNTLSLAFEGVDGQSLMIRLDLLGISVSTGTACSSGVTLPSEVLTAMGIEEALIHSTLRLSLGRQTTEKEMERVIDAMVRSVEEVRSRKSVLT